MSFVGNSVSDFMKWNLERHYERREAKRVGKQNRNGRLGAAVANAMKKVVAIKCESCESPIGYVETAALATLKPAPAAWCNKYCIRIAAEGRLDQKTEDPPKAERIRIRLTTKGQKVKKCDVDVCTLPMPHTHCNECGSTTHGAAYCDNMG